MRCAIFTGREYISARLTGYALDAPIFSLFLHISNSNGFVLSFDALHLLITYKSSFFWYLIKDNKQ